MDQMRDETWSEGLEGVEWEEAMERRDVPLDESQTSVSEEPEYIKAACAAAEELGEACSGPAVCRMLQVLPGHQRKQALCQPEINDCPREMYWCLHQRPRADLWQHQDPRQRGCPSGLELMTRQDTGLSASIGDDPVSLSTSPIGRQKPGCDKPLSLYSTPLELNIMFSLASSLLINSIFSPIDTERFSLLKEEGPFQSDSHREEKTWSPILRRKSNQELFKIVIKKATQFMPHLLSGWHCFIIILIISFQLLNSSGKWISDYHVTAGETEAQNVQTTCPVSSRYWLGESRFKSTSASLRRPHLSPHIMPPQGGDAGGRASGDRSGLRSSPPWGLEAWVEVLGLPSSSGTGTNTWLCGHRCPLCNDKVCWLPRPTVLFPRQARERASCRRKKAPRVAFLLSLVLDHLCVIDLKQSPEGEPEAEPMASLLLWVHCWPWSAPCGALRQRPRDARRKAPAGLQQS